MKFALLSVLMALTSIVGLAGMSPAVSFADAKTDVCNGIGATNCSSATDATNTITSIASLIVTVLGILIGVTAVIMIIIAGFKYITSGGDSNAIASAKKTLIYALVGLAVAAIAQFLVHFVLTQSTTCTSSTKPTSKTSQCVLKP